MASYMRIANRAGEYGGHDLFFLTYAEVRTVYVYDVSVCLLQTMMRWAGDKPRYCSLRSCLK